MEKKYEFTNFSIMYKGRRLHQIRLLRDCGGFVKGTLGGFIESESNLSHNGDCWVVNFAYVYGNARVSGNAKIYQNAQVFDNAKISDRALVAGFAKIYGCAIVCENARVYGNAQIFGHTLVDCRATVIDYAVVCGRAEVSDYAIIKDRAIIDYNARIRGYNTIINGDTFLNHDELIEQGVMSKNTLEEQIRCQTGLAPFNGSVIAYKIVAPDLTSFYDRNFKYEIGEWAIAEDPDESDKVCASGLHFSNATYWDKDCWYNNHDGVYLIARINLEDIITVQRGKIRCRKAFVLGVYDKEST